VSSVVTGHGSESTLGPIHLRRRLAEPGRRHFGCSAFNKLLYGILQQFVAAF
jgi:hypothetical protein